MRGPIIAVVFALALTGCGATAAGGREQAPAADEPPASGRSAVERCTERLLRDAQVEELTEAERAATRRYLEATYCGRFAARGWVYDDGTLSIAVQDWLEQSGTEVCAEAEEAAEGEPAKATPCDEPDAGGPRTIADCSLLEHVRASEVREYLDRLQRRHGAVECGDGTPLAELGAP